MTRSEEPMELGHIGLQRKCFLCHKGCHVTRKCRPSREKTVNAVEQLKNPNRDVSKVQCW